MSFYTENEINELKAAALYYKLDAPQAFWWGETGQLMDWCNGIGSEDMSDKQREALTWALKRYEVCAAIHDVAYEVQTGSRAIADKQMEKNMLKVWAKDFGIFRWLKPSARIERRVVIPAVYEILKRQGQKAWDAVKDEKEGDKE